MIKFEANFGADDHISSINKISKIRGYPMAEIQ
jgi:hypothetical protein